MNTFALRTAITSAAIAAFFALGSGVATAAPAFHGDPNTPGTQLHVHNDHPMDNNSYQCGAIGVGGAGVGSNPPEAAGNSTASSSAAAPSRWLHRK